MKFYQTVSEIARAAKVARNTATRWRDDGLLGDPTADGWSASTVAKVAKDHHARRAATAGRRELSERKAGLQCKLLEVAIARDKLTLECEKLKTASMQASVISTEDHRATMKIIREMYFTGLDSLVVEAVAAVPSVEHLLVVAIDNLRKRITGFPDLVRR